MHSNYTVFGFSFPFLTYLKVLFSRMQRKLDEEAERRRCEIETDLRGRLEEQEKVRQQLASELESTNKNRVKLEEKLKSVLEQNREEKERLEV